MIQIKITPAAVNRADSRKLYASTINVKKRIAKTTERIVVTQTQKRL